MIVSLAGPSGVGKTTLLFNLLKALPDAKPLVSVTTRAPRPTDEAFEYVSDAEFGNIAKRGEFLWQVHPHGKHYGTRKVVIDEALASNIIYIPVLIIEAVKVLYEYAAHQGALTAVKSFYLWIEDEEELRKRFEMRGDMNKEQVESRIVECRSWNFEAQRSGVPFIYLDATKTPDELLRQALSYLA